MGYRGEDLDLRTPQSAVRASPDLSATDISRPRGYRSEPIWVDDTVLACCNLAYDLAVTHRAGEVRLEHLAYAMTRLDNAAEAMEARGVKVAALRRELGNVVAGEIPVGLASGKATPRRSEDFEAVLRDASDIAQRRNSPASAEDLVSVLIDTSRDLPGLMFIRRHLGRPPLADRDYEPVPRPRETARAYAAAYEPRAVWTEPSPAAATRSDALQNNRIEALEQAVRALGADLSNERKTVSNLLIDIQRDLSTRRDDSAMADRLGAVEMAIDKRLADLARNWNGLNDKLKSLEAAILSRPVDSAIEPMRLIERLETIEQVVLDRASDSAAEASKLAERLKALEDGQAAQKVQALQLNSALAAEVNKLVTAMSQQPGVERMMPAINERFQALTATLERQRVELASALAQPVGERLTAIGAGLDARQQEGTRALTALAERIGAIERAVATYVQRVSEQSATFGQEVGKIQGDLTRLSTGQTAVASAVDQWRQQAGELGIIGNRLAAIERLSSRPAQMIEQLAEKVDAMHRLTAEKAAKRSAFYYWLFGTNDWRGASYPKRRAIPAGVAAPQPTRPMPVQPAQAPQVPRAVPPAPGQQQQPPRV